MLARIEERLKARIGMDPGSIGPGALAAAVRGRMEACGIGTIEVYAAHIDRAVGELDALIESVVVNETWFFRDEEPFQALARAASAWKLASHWVGTFRVLSVPCATGEEPYSVAMTLLDAGLGERFAIDAIDVSARALEIAARGVYGAKSFRSRNAGFRKRFFKTRQNGEEILDIVRNRVKFTRASILDPDLGRGRGPYDAIFCRNLFIYLDRESRVRALDALAGMLLDGGTLFVGHAETLESFDDRFERVGPVGAFAYARCKSSVRERSPLGLPSVSAAPRGRSNARIAAPPKRQPAEPAPVRFVPSEPPADTTLETAGELANRGDLVEAAELCKQVIARDPVRADAYCLFGVIRTAEGSHTEAEQHFRRALYLDPKHYDALVHLALLCERLGDTGGATQLRRRADRVRSIKGNVP